MKRPKGKPPSQRKANTSNRKLETILNVPEGNMRPQEAIRNSNVRYHEAGHAVACLVLGLGLEYIEIGAIPIPGGTSHGRTVPTLTALDAAGNRELCFRLAIQALAGQESETKFDPSVNYTGKATTDMEGAQYACAWCLCELTDKEDGKKGLSPEQWHSHKPEIQAMTREALAGARQLVRDHWSSIDRLAQALSNRSRMTGDEVRVLIPKHRLPLD